MSNDKTQVTPFEKEPTFEEESEISERFTPMEIQNKIVAYLELGKKDLSENTQVEIDEATRNKFLMKVASGEIGDQQFQELIQDVTMIDESEDKDLAASYKEQINDLQKMAEQEYPELAIQKSLKEAKIVVASVRDDGDRCMISAEEYGWNNISMRIAENTTKTYEGIDKVEMIYPSRSRQIVDQVEPDENATFNPDKRKLQEAGLSPMYRLQIGPRIRNCSLPSELGNGYTAVILYVEEDDKVTARTVYRDNDLGRWQYANEKTYSFDRRQIFVEDEIQNFLDEITTNGQPKVEVSNPNEIFPEILRKNVP